MSAAGLVGAACVAVVVVVVWMARRGSAGPTAEWSTASASAREHRVERPERGPYLGVAIGVARSGSFEPALCAGEAVPATGHVDVVTTRADQQTLDVTLLTSSGAATDRPRTLCGLKIVGVPPAPKGQSSVRLYVRVSDMGRVVVGARLRSQRVELPVEVLDEHPVVPIGRG